MNLSERLLAEFKREVETTRRVLERVPGDRLAWKPHSKSMSLGQLALHIAKTPGGVATFLAETTREAPDFQHPQPQSLAEVFDALDESEDTVIAALAAWGEPGLLVEWRMTHEGRTLMAMPRLDMARSIMLNHWYHHRGELMVYLRLLDVPLPVVYGPTADESPFTAASAT